ncbi:MAG: cardiolipin synthase [Clostridium sp.]|nr:cardiolipin synthase [Clostridium sp.]MDU7083772.1 cardiolipin synthase [Clostridium sp.]
MIVNILSIIVQLINIITIFYMIFKEKRSANSVVAWTLLLYIMPYIGFIIYLLVGRKINNKKIYILKEDEIKMFKKYENHIKKRDELNLQEKNIRMIRAIENMGYFPYRNNNKIEMFFDGKDFFDHLIESLKKAEKRINIQFYIFKSDEIGRSILNILKEKAEDGVEVRLLYDSVGSRSLNKEFLKDLRAVGVKTGEFFPSWLRFININMNFRNHRKIVVIDNRTAFVGGFNVGDEYLGKDPKFGYWRDTHIKFKGPAVKDLNLRFLADWRSATKEDIGFEHVLDGVDELKEVNEELEINDGIQIIASGPNPNNFFEIKLSYLKMIQNAKEYVYIQSPYLVIDNSVADSLKLAAVSGVDVRVMIPGKGDHPFIYWANSVYAGELLNFGVKIYRYDKNAFLHSKTVVIDDEICSVGTANMDTRSFELNFEVNALIYSEKIAREQRKHFEEDMLKSVELTAQEYKKRGTTVKIKEAISKLFSGVL